MKTLVWQFSREPKKEMSSFKKYKCSVWGTSPNEQGKWLTIWGTNWFGDELHQETKSWCIIAPIEQYSGYRYFQWKKKVLQSSMPWFCYFYKPFLVIYLSMIESLICHREMSLIWSTAFGFVQNTIHDFQNTVLNS